MAVTAEQDAYLRDHRWALIATIGSSGGPQVTMVAYHWDSHDVVMSIRSTTVKWRNVVARPQVCVTVAEGEQCLSLYGDAEAIDTDPERAELTDRLLASLQPAHAAILAADIAAGLDATDRVIVRLAPTRAVGRI
jgi:PPOX class probable F420-dependent enzyme